jgi:hypothetical protein
VQAGIEVSTPAVPAAASGSVATIFLDPAAVLQATLKWFALVPSPDPPPGAEGIGLTNPADPTSLAVVAAMSEWAQINFDRNFGWLQSAQEFWTAVQNATQIFVSSDQSAAGMISRTLA